MSGNSGDIFDPNVQRTLDSLEQELANKTGRPVFGHAPQSAEFFSGDPRDASPRQLEDQKQGEVVQAIKQGIREAIDSAGQGDRQVSGDDDMKTVMLELVTVMRELRDQVSYLNASMEDQGGEESQGHG